MFRIRSLRLFLGVLIAVCLAEAAVPLFRSLPRRDGDGAVYSWRSPAPAVPVEDRNTEMAREQYRPDRGGQWKIEKPGGLLMSVYYFEWDALETAPTMILDSHHAEICNVSAGFKILDRLPSHLFEAPGGEKVEFDATRYADPAGGTVYVFKNVWLANTGNWELRHKKRDMRLRLSFVRRNDAARLLEGGIYEAADAEEAWETFHADVLSHLDWKRTAPGK